jgi:hypothetical protein
MHGGNQTIDGNSQILEAVNIPPCGSGSSFNTTAQCDQVTYYVVRTSAHVAKTSPHVTKTATLGEKRSSGRRRTRLRTGKIVDPRRPNLIECQIYDWSETGARLRLFTNLSVPSRIQVFEDISERLLNATVVWRRRSEIGVRFAPHVQQRNLTKAQLTSLRTGYNPAKA